MHLSFAPEFWFLPIKVMLGSGERPPAYEQLIPAREHLPHIGFAYG